MEARMKPLFPIPHTVWNDFCDTHHKMYEHNISSIRCLGKRSRHQRICFFNAASYLVAFCDCQVCEEWAWFQGTQAARRAVQLGIPGVKHCTASARRGKVGMTQNDSLFYTHADTLA